MNQLHVLYRIVRQTGKRHDRRGFLETVELRQASEPVTHAEAERLARNQTEGRWTILPVWIPENRNRA